MGLEGGQKYCEKLDGIFANLKLVFVSVFSSGRDDDDDDVLLLIWFKQSCWLCYGGEKIINKLRSVVCPCVRKGPY